jgi:23S rRNA pseudouridine2605 synthase
MARFFASLGDFYRKLRQSPRMVKPPSRSSSPRNNEKPPRIRWDNKPTRRARPASNAPTKGALERDDGDARIAKLLARAGVASRREVERMIEDKRVTLNGEVVETPATLLKNLDGVAVDGVAVGKPAPTMLYMFHKPEGCLTAERDFSGRNTIYDLLPTELPRVMPIGRLDLNTEGLLLLTNDGEFKRQMELPSTGIERTYRARCFGMISQAELEELIHGIEVDGVQYGKIDANMERRTGANVWIEMTLTEGKNREVRRVLEHLGLEVNRLIRTRYGPFVLGNIASGKVAEVRKVDLLEFRASLKKNTTKN